MAQYVAVVGLGFVGRTTLRYLAGAGIAVRGYDRSEAAMQAARKALAEELGPGASWGVGTDPSVVAAAEAVFVAVRLTRDDQGRFASEPLQEVAAMLRRHGSDGQIVLIESTLPPGTTRRFAAWLDRPGIDIAHAPERLRVGERRRHAARGAALGRRPHDTVHRARLRFARADRSAPGAGHRTRGL